jgi:hypothetical protein
VVGKTFSRYNAIKVLRIEETTSISKIYPKVKELKGEIGFPMTDHLPPISIHTSER